MTDPTRLRLLALSLSFAAAACSSGSPAPLDGPVPEGKAASVVSKRLCHELRACDCGKAAGVSLDGCSTGLGYAWQASIEEAEENGWTYDGECVQRRLNYLLERGCEKQTTSGYYPGCGGETCLVYHGDVPEGGDCEGSAAASDCQQGLVCLGTCEEPCASAPAGPLEEGDTCMEDGSYVGTCDPATLLCDPGSGLCVPRPGEGEPCISGQCAEGHWCDTSSGEPICAAQLAGGAECTTPQQCLTFVCDEGTCASPPAEGEPCLESPRAPCGERLACADGVCVEPPGKGKACLETTTGLTQCAEGLVCGARLCSITPSAPGCDECEVPADECTVRVCIEEPAAVCSDQGGLLF